ncbi:hypothetical protein [Kutzneria albida]|uniref:Secreted protein n=1 Tax=Kutzneria albida DSM 43870 TaxID=1449976 RepID=W5WHY8_9PSEU|nr:hypothetical protein [Kutzneria albida]AHI00814.1 hypothetical protein KALB_7456 [Kutzneria albida DSM 43870]
MHKWFLRAAVVAAVGFGLPTLIATTAQAAAVAAPTPRAPLAPPLAEDRSYRTWRVEDYVEAWERYHGREMTEDERENLARGCIGVTVVNLNREDLSNPPLNLSFGSLRTAEAVQAALNKIVDTHPSPAQYEAAVAKDPILKRLKNVVKALPSWIDSAKLKASIFSKRFYSWQNPDWSEERAHTTYRPDRETDQVDMSTYRYRARPGYVNFDYGWFDQDTNTWWHANHEEPRMVVYQSTLRHYSRPLQDFDEQVFTVAFAKKD